MSNENVNENTILYEFTKNSKERIRISFTEYKGMKLLEIRCYYQASDGSGEWKPSPKGISFRVEQLDEIMKGLEIAKAFLRR
jgi:hypothetical protein